jgi:hypothetical protein
LRAGTNAVAEGREPPRARHAGPPGWVIAPSGVAGCAVGIIVGVEQNESRRIAAHSDMPGLAEASSIGAVRGGPCGRVRVTSVAARWGTVEVVVTDRGVGAESPMLAAHRSISAPTAVRANRNRAVKARTSMVGVWPPPPTITSGS